jgi:4-hydroxybenzoate polyprenyltransferase
MQTPKSARDFGTTSGGDTSEAAATPLPQHPVSPPPPALAAATVVQVVDLDAGLLRTDVLIEQTLRLVRADLLVLLWLPLWLWRRLWFGVASFQAEVAKRLPLDPASIPYDADTLAATRRRLDPTTAAAVVSALDQTWATGIARHLGFNGPVIAAGGDVRLTGPARQARLDAEFGPGGYRIVGAEQPALDQQPLRLRPYLKALRPHQWLKNALVFVPIVLAHKIFEPLALVQGITAFVAFSLTASSVYLLNDLVDLADDRAHATKRRRPLAAGDVPLWHGLALVPTLLALAIGLSLAVLPLPFTGVLVVYYAVTLAYSFFLKRTMLFDVITLASLYTLRIIAGSAAVGIARSFWLLAFSVFLFFSLALVKRYVEIKDMVDAAAASNETPSQAKVRGRGYHAIDLETLSQFGIASGLMAVLVLALYIDSSVVKSLYRNPEMIWLLCPLMLYLICRFWILARRGDMHEDPIVFAARDWRSQMVVASGLVLLLLAMVL